LHVCGGANDVRIGDVWAGLREVATSRRPGGWDREPPGLEPWVSLVRPSFALGLDR